MRIEITPELVFISAWSTQLGIVAFDLLGVGGHFLSGQSIVICLAGMVFVLLGCFTARALPNASSKRPVLSASRLKLIILVLGILSSFGAGIVAMRWIELGIDPIGGATLNQMNTVYLYERDAFGGWAGRLYALTPMLLLTALYAVKVSAISSRAAAFCCLMAVLLMLSPRRATMVTALIAGAMLLASGQKIDIVRKVFIVGPLILGSVMAFGYSQYALGKIPDFSFAAAFEVVAVYAGSSIYVMDGLLSTNHFKDTYILLNIPARALNAMFGTDLNVDLSVPFGFADAEWNTVPLFYYYFRSWGWSGVVVFSWLTGLISVLSYRLAIARQSFTASIIAALMITGLALSVRENLFFSYDFLWWCFVAFFGGVLARSRIGVAR